MENRYFRRDHLQVLFIYDIYLRTSLRIMKLGIILKIQPLQWAPLGSVTPNGERARPGPLEVLGLIGVHANGPMRREMWLSTTNQITRLVVFWAWSLTLMNTAPYYIRLFLFSWPRHQHRNQSQIKSNQSFFPEQSVQEINRYIYYIYKIYMHFVLSAFFKYWTMFRDEWKES